MEETLVMCIGNRARGDDGVAWEVARILGSHEAAGLRIVTATSLDVTHAEDVSASDRLIVVDAIRRDDPTFETVAIQDGTAVRDTHGMTPTALLTLAAKLYGKRPEQAWLVCCAAPSMEHEGALSQTAKDAAQDAATEVLRLASDGC